MLERYGHPLDLYDNTPGAWLVVVTNGVVDDGVLVMDSGRDAVVKRRFPGVDKAIGTLVEQHGNVPVALPKARILTWPVKPTVHVLADGRRHPGWMCTTRITTRECLEEVSKTTARSGERLVPLVASLKIGGPIFMPRPGCGFGALDWRKLKPWMEERFDDRFVVVDPAR